MEKLFPFEFENSFFTWESFGLKFSEFHKEINRVSNCKLVTRVSYVSFLEKYLEGFEKKMRK